MFTGEFILITYELSYMFSFHIPEEATCFNDERRYANNMY